jgi:hypothetical protein
MSNFYTDCELPIITLRTKFYSRKTFYSPSQQLSSRPRGNSLDLISKLVGKSLHDGRLVSLGQREVFRETERRCKKELYVTRQMGKKDHIISLRSAMH